jgi:molecular chaperone IbpA
MTSSEPAATASGSRWLWQALLQKTSRSFQRNLLTVAGEKSDGKDQEYLFKGISGPAFERKFSLADYVEVERAHCDNGLLQIDLVCRVPDAMKPRAIAIEAGPQQGSNVASLKAA